MIQISEPITLENLLPLIQKLPKVEREQLRKSLEADSTTWQEEWEAVVRLDAAILLYRLGEVTLARAAELAEIHRFEFEAVLETKGIPKMVEVDSAEALQAGVSLIKRLHQSNGETEGA
jgi:predicted HTH domain antitoxin